VEAGIVREVWVLAQNSGSEPLPRGTRTLAISTLVARPVFGYE